MRDDTGEIVGLCCISRDITERTRTEELLRQERESLYAILDRAPYGVMVRDQDGKTLYVNSEFTAITGYTLADIPTIRDWGKLAYPKKKHRNASRAAWEKDIAQRATDGVFHQKLGRLFTRTYSIVTKGGAIKDIEFRPTLLADGRTLLMLSDITERKRAEEALRQNEEQLRMLIETTKVGVSAIDGKGVTTYANEQLCTMLGRSSDEIVGHSVFDFLDAKNRKILKTLLSGRKQRRSDDTPFEITWTKKDGSKVHTILSLTPYFDAQGLHHSSFAIVTDITERIRMEEQLRQSEERFRRLVETMRVGLSAIDANGVITYVNDQACKMLGYSRSEIIGRPTVDFYDKASRKHQEEIIAKRKKGVKDPTPYEITWVAKNSQKVHTILTPTPSFSADGRFIGSFALFTDITERKRIEEAAAGKPARVTGPDGRLDLGITWADKEETSKYNNRKVRRTFGYTVAERYANNRCFGEFEKPILTRPARSQIPMATRSSPQRLRPKGAETPIEMPFHLRA